MNRITVILPTYNRLNLLKNAYLSCKNQTSRNFDLIIIDNASTDGTGEYLQSLENDGLKKSVIINESNIGSVKSIQSAINKASTEWITILCDDDYFEQGFISVVSEKVQYTSKDLILVGFNNVDVRGACKSTVCYNSESLDLDTALTKIFGTAEIRLAGISGFVFKRCLAGHSIRIKDYPKGFLSDTMIIAESAICGSGAETLSDVLYNRLVWDGSESAFSLHNLKTYNQALLEFHQDMVCILAEKKINRVVKKTLIYCQPLWQFFWITCLPILRYGTLAITDIGDFKKILSQNQNYSSHLKLLKLVYYVCKIVPLSTRLTIQHKGKRIKTYISRITLADLLSK